MFCCLLLATWWACRGRWPDGRARCLIWCRGSQTLFPCPTCTQNPLHTRGVYEQLKAALQLPAECVQKGKALGGGMRALFASGERHLLPSFFHLLRHMHAQVRGQWDMRCSMCACEYADACWRAR